MMTGIFRRFRLITLAALLAAALTPFASSAEAGRRSAGYVSANKHFFVYETRTPGEIGVHLGITQIHGFVSDHSLLVQTFGDIPLFPEFLHAARDYVDSKPGRCRIIDHYELWMGEVRFIYTCR